MPTARTCKGCGQHQPLDRFPLYTVDGRQYRRARCRPCYREQRNATKAAGVCSSCNNMKDAHEFPGYGSRICFPCRRRLGQARPREERQGEKRRAAEREGREYQTADERGCAYPGEGQPYQRTRCTWVGVWVVWRLWTKDRYRHDAGFREANKAKYRAYYQKNRRKECLRITKWKHANPDKTARQGELRWRRAAAASDGSLTKERIGRLLEDAKRCHYCRCRLTESNKTIDHSIPLGRGGLHSVSNVVVACGSCNASKGARDPSQWTRTGQLGLCM